MSTPIRVTVWNEFIHERQSKVVQAIYPDGIHATIAKALSAAGDVLVRTAIQDQPEHGLTDEVLEQTDVLIWWGQTALLST